jgi:hypothetical protein
MKNLFTVICSIFILTFSSQIFSQTNSSANWRLTEADTTSAVVLGNINALPAEGKNIQIRDYTGVLNNGSGGPLGNFQRWFINANWPDENSQNNDRYVQFTATPNVGFDFDVTSVSLYLNAGGTSNMKANIYVSTDSSFSNSILLSTPGGVLVTRDSAQIYSYNINSMAVDSGSNFYLRIYPWLPGGSTNTGKYIFLQDVIISGITLPSDTVLPLKIVTSGINGITSNSAECGGNVLSDGGKSIIARGICWNTAGSPDTSDDHTLDGAGTGVFQSSLKNLAPETEYYVRAYVTNTDTTVYGSEISFTTKTEQILAFPGAEGFGRFTTGGRGGRVLEVTNLNDDSNPGSFRWAISQNFPRIIVFRISGTIMLQSDLNINYGNLTIAGQTAPGDGICIANHTVECKASNVIVRYMRFRLGDLTQEANDSFWGRDQKNIILDHCSLSWAIDEDGSWYDNTDFTMQWCIYSESLYHSYHPKGDHGYGGIWGGMGATFHHNLLADNSSRNPRFNGARYNSTHQTELADYRNNVIFNWGFNSAYGGESGNYNMINNYYKPGPATSSGNKQYRIVNPSDPLNPSTGYSKWYINGNYVEGDPQVTADNWNGGVQPDQAPLDSLKLDNPLPAAPVNTQTAQDAYDTVLAYAGCSFPIRDSADLRVINEVRTGNAPFGASYNGGGKGIIDSQNDVGGWPTLKSLPAPLDSDHDGMPDDWENAHGLNPNDSSDARIVASDGYTMIEEYINSIILSNPTSVKSVNSLPENFIVKQNFPNPFNPATQIEYSIPEAGNVAIKIYNITGQMVKVLINGYESEGNYNIYWNGTGENSSSLPSGIYFCEVRFGNSFKVIKMMLLK